MSIEGDAEPNEPPSQQPAQGEQPSARRERFWDLKASHWVEVFLTVVLICVGALQFMVYTRQANIMEIEQRPWISLESVKIISPLMFDGSTAHISLGYQLKNVGHSPAFNTIFYSAVTAAWVRDDGGLFTPNVTRGGDDPLPPKVGLSHVSKIACEQVFTFSDLKEQFRNLDERLKGQHAGYDFISTGNVILPDKVFDGEFRFAAKDTLRSDRPDNARSYMLLLTACARYIDPQSGNVHFTPVGYIISGIDAPLPLDQKPVPAERLRLQLIGQYAD